MSNMTEIYGPGGTKFELEWETSNSAVLRLVRSSPLPGGPNMGTLDTATAQALASALNRGYEEPERPIEVGDVLYVGVDYERRVVFVNADLNLVVSIDTDDGNAINWTVSQALEDRKFAERELKARR